jgi:hypothetical protein
MHTLRYTCLFLVSSHYTPAAGGYSLLTVATITILERYNMDTNTHKLHALALDINALVDSRRRYMLEQSMQHLDEAIDIMLEAELPPIDPLEDALDKMIEGIPFIDEPTFSYCNSCTHQQECDFTCHMELQQLHQDAHTVPTHDDIPF